MSRGDHAVLASPRMKRAFQVFRRYIAQPGIALSMRPRILPLLATALGASVLASCFSELTGPTCTPTPFSIASTSGDTVITSTTLRYIEGEPGNSILGTTDWCRAVAIHYEARLTDGTLFDDSRASERPLIFLPGTGQIIDGIEQGVIGMDVGGTRRLIIPPELGFGSEPRRDQTGQIVVPANSTVIYDIEILEVGA